MNPTQKPGAPGVEYPRGEVEILPPGHDRGPTRESGAGEQPFGYQRTSGRAFTFRTGPGGGFLTMVVAGVLAVALFTFLASALAIIATVAVIGVAGFYLRNSLRRWFGR